VTTAAAKAQLEAVRMPAGRWHVELAHGRRRPIDRHVSTSRTTDPGGTANRAVARRDEMAHRQVARDATGIRPRDLGVTVNRAIDRPRVTHGRRAPAAPRHDRMVHDRAMAARAPIASRVGTATRAGAAGRDAIPEPCPPRTAIVPVATTPLGHGPRPHVLVGATGCRRGVSRRRERQPRSARPKSRLPGVFANPVNKPSRRRGNAKSGSTTAHCGPQLVRRPHAPSVRNRPNRSTALRGHVVASPPTWLPTWPTNSSNRRQRREPRSTRSG